MHTSNFAARCRHELLSHACYGNINKLKYNCSWNARHRLIICAGAFSLLPCDSIFIFIEATPFESPTDCLLYKHPTEQGILEPIFYPYNAISIAAGTMCCTFTSPSASIPLENLQKPRLIFALTYPTSLKAPCNLLSNICNPHHCFTLRLEYQTLELAQAKVAEAELLN